MEHITCTKYVIAASWGVALLTLSSCTSLEGAKYNYGASDKTGKLKGVPFTLNKPVPTVVHTPATDDKRETYTTTFAYTADSEHRYTLTMNPSYLASVDFSLSFDALGSFTEGSAKATDQTAAVLTSAGKLALATFDTSQRAVDTNVARLIETGDSMKLIGEDKKNWESVKTGLRRLQTDKKVKDEYVYKLPGERTVLRKIYTEAISDLVARANNYQPPAVDKDISAPINQPPVPIQPKRVGDTRSNADIAADELADASDFRAVLDRVKTSKDQLFADAVMQAMNSGNVSALSRARIAEVAILQGQRASLELNESSTTLEASKETISRISLLDSATNAIPKHLRLAQSMAELSPTDWKRRTIAVLNTEIDALSHTVRINLANSLQPLPPLGTHECPVITSKASTPQKKGGVTAKTRSPVEQKPATKAALETLCELREKKAIVLGISAEHRRRTELAAKLATAETPKELKLLRDEITALDTTISDAESSLKAKAKETKAEEPYTAFYRNITSETEETPDSALALVGAKRPKYVILVRSLDVKSPAIPQVATPPLHQPGNGHTGVQEPKTGDLGTPTAPPVPPTQQ